MTIDRPITIILILLAILLIAFFLVVPEYKMFKKLQAELAEKVAEFNAKHDYYSAVDKAYFELQSRKNDIKKVDIALPEDRNLNELVYFLQKTAKENGLVAKNLFLSPPSSFTKKDQKNKKIVGDVKEIVLSMDLSGDYSSLKNFIISLEKSARIFEVIRISFGSAPNPPYKFSIQIKTYSY